MVSKFVLDSLIYRVTGSGRLVWAFPKHLAMWDALECKKLSRCTSTVSCNLDQWPLAHFSTTDTEVVWIVIELVTIYVFFVETAGKTLEELSVIFNARNPAKKSLEKTKLAVDQGGRVMSVSGRVV